MAKRDKIYLFLFGVIVALYIAFEVTGPEPTDWSESYIMSDKIPYGAYILREELDQLFPNQKVQNLTIPPFEYLRSPQYVASERRNWIFINNTIAPDSLELGLLMDAVSRGDHLFISAMNTGDALANTLGFDVNFQTPLSAVDSIGSLTDSTRFQTEINFANPQLQKEGGWKFEERRSAYFSSVDTSGTTLLGYSGSQRPNFIRMSHGSGTIYIHLFPRAFTNYYVRDRGFASYAFKTLSYLPVQDVIWDEYYKAGRSGYTTPMGFVLNQPSLRNAWLTILTGIFLFMIFKGRRVQRAIPEVNAPVNSTLEFARTIGSLYLEKGTHKEIALKKIWFFTDYCRRHLAISISDDPVKAISERSGVPEPDISEMMDSIRRVRKKPDISKEELKNVTSKIDQFYKKSLR